MKVYENVDELVELYCRSMDVAKGEAPFTPGWASLDRLRERLVHENGNRRLKVLDDATSIRAERVELRTIRLNMPYLARVEPRPMTRVEGCPPVAGVLLEGTVDGRRRLIDGYHRCRKLLDDGVLDGLFFILSTRVVY